MSRYKHKYSMLHKAQNIALGFFQGNDLFINIYRITSQILCQAESHRRIQKWIKCGIAMKDIRPWWDSVHTMPKHSTLKTKYLKLKESEKMAERRTSLWPSLSLLPWNESWNSCERWCRKRCWVLKPTAKKELLRHLWCKKKWFY